MDSNEKLRRLLERTTTNEIKGEVSGLNNPNTNLSYLEQQALLDAIRREREKNAGK